MGYPSRRESRPGATRRLTAFALSLALVSQGSSPALAAVAPKVRAVSASLPSPLPPAEALRDAVTASGWAPAPAILSVVPVATPRLVVPAGPQAAFDALAALLQGEPGADALRRAVADAADAAPAPGRAAAREWALRHGTSARAARAALPELARALGLNLAAAPDSRAALAAHDQAAARVAALALPDFGEPRAIRATQLPAALNPVKLPPLSAAMSERELRERLGQSGDLAGGAAGADEIARLDRLLERVSPLLPEGQTGTGAEDSRESKWASLEALRRMFDGISASPSGSPAVKPDLAGTPAEAAVAARLSRVEALNAELQGNLALRDAAEAMLSVADRSRSAALRERRDGRDTLEFRKNFARLAMVMDLSYSLNLLNSADAALGKMEALVDDKLKLIEKRRADNAGGAAGAGEQAGRTEEWKKEAEAQAADDAKKRDDFASLAVRLGGLSAAVARFRAEVSGLLSSIDARDRGRSADAPTEYDRRLALLPSLVEGLQHGSSNPSGVSDLSLDYLQAKSAEVAGYRAKLAEADSRIGSAPVEFAGVLVIAVPGVPSETVSNPTLAQTRALLERRRAFWRGQHDEHATLLAAITRAMDPNGTTRVADDFGGTRLESLVAWRAEQLALEERLGSASDSLAASADELSALIEKGAPGAALPRLRGRSADDLRTVLPDLLDRLDAVTFPDTDAGFDAKTRKIDLSRLVPFLGDLTVRRLEAAATAKALEKPVRDVLPKAKAAFERSVAGMQTMLDDISLDEAYITAGAPAAQGQGLIDRKRSLLNETMKPMLVELQDLLDKTLIPFQRDRIAQSDPSGDEDGYATLYREKKNLYVKISDGLRKALPWGLASNGAKAYDAGAARVGIAEVRNQYEDYKKIVVDYQDSMRRRKDPANTEMEDLYGESVPYSLVRRAAVYREERRGRAVKMNASAVVVNNILSQLDGLTSNTHNFAVKYKLPVDLDPESPSTGPRLTSMADARTLQNMASAIKQVADAALAASGGTELAVGGGSGIPTGTQPPLDVSQNQKIALLGLEAIKRLVPTTASSTGDSYAECLARFLFADALVSTSDSYLKDRIPVFEAFLARAAAGLNAGLADLDADLAWVGGDLSGGEAVLARKVSAFDSLSAVAREGADLFGQKTQWSQEGVGTVGRVQTYYDTLGEVYSSGDEALDAERKAALEFRDALAKSRKGIQEQRTTVVGWLQQLDNPNETALARVAQNISQIQDRTRGVLETNIEARRAERARDGAAKAVADTLKALGVERAALDRELEPVGDLGRLSPELASRVTAVGRTGPAWLAENRGGPQTMVIPKSQFERFLSQLFGALSADAAARDLVAIREQILKDPRALSQLLPGTKMVEVGEGTDGFYLVYQSEFSTPGGLETAQQVTFGNALKLWGQNVSVIGHRFASPPSSGNAPFGDQGVTVRVESLDSDHMVNYLDVTFHKFVQDIPPDLTVGSQAREARMMVFDDFALMVADGKVYFGAAGFADFAANDSGGKPSYYGGNLKSKIKFSKVLSLNAEQTALFAKDPRRFLQEVNLDFTGYDPTLDQSFLIEGRGQDREYTRSKLGVGVDLAAALDQKDTFNLEFYYSKTGGTDPLTQQALGATILKGFTFDVGGHETRLSVGGGAEHGERIDSFNGRLSYEIPDLGWTINAQGKLAGSGAAYFAEVRKRTGENSELALSYGSRYIGLNDRLTVSFESTYTLGELWRSVTGAAAEDLRGGKTMAEFDSALSDFFARDEANDPALAELARAFDADAGRRLIVLEIGRLSREVATLQKSGAFLDNIRQRAMVGFVSGPVGPGTAERATGGGFQVGTQTEMTLSKSQRELVEARSAALFALGLDLEERLLDTAKAWQSALAEIALAKWRRHLAVFLAAHADDQVLRAEAEARVIEASDDLRRATLRYAALTGRGPEDPLPFDGVNPNDLDRVLRLVARALASPERLGALFARARTSMKVPEASLAVLDWIPWIEKFTIGVGAQLPDLMSSQALGVAVTVRLPIYDPTKGKVDESFTLQSQASILEMAARLKSTRLRARSERIAARGWNERARGAEASASAARLELSDGIRLYRNALIGAPELRARARRWLDAATDALTCGIEGSLHDAWASLDAAGQPLSPSGETRAEPKDMNAAYDQAVAQSASWEALARRSQAARELLEASDRRIRKVDVDLSVGANITAAGVALIPAFGLTGLAVLPVVGIELAPEELRQLDAGRRGAEADMYTRLQDKAAADMALNLTRALLEASYAAKQIALYEGEVIPGLVAAQDGSPALAEQLRAARARLSDLTARLRESQVAANHLLGRPLDSRLLLTVDAESALASLAARSAALNPAAASRDALESRLKIARSVEAAVDKGLRVDRLRLDPISMVGRSLGRLIAALSGDGLPSPEIVAIARERTLAAERALEAFDEALPAMRSSLSSELSRIRAARGALAGRSDAASRAQALELERQEAMVRAQIAVWGGAKAEEAAAIPGSYAELQDRLREAALRQTPPKFDSRDLGAFEAGPPLDAMGSIRFYDHRQTLSGEPVGQSFVEGWLEARLRSPSTPPEAMLALAKLREERADEVRRSGAASARARADMALARLRFDAALMRWSEGVGIGEAARARVARDLAETAAFLHLPPGTPPEALLALLPAHSDGDLASAAAREVSEAEAFDLDLLKKTLFTSGLPEELAGRDRLPQLRADLLAEKMSSRGFTPLAAIGLFRGSWVQGAFLEAPDPERVRAGLVEVIDDALRRELEDSQRLQSLSLLLHTLMASVAEKTRLVAALRLRELAARRNLLGAVERVRLKLSPVSEIADAQAETSRAQFEFVAGTQALAEDFARLTAELTALGVTPSVYARPRSSDGERDPLEPAERTARARLLAWWADRLLDADFERRNDELLAGAPESIRAELRVLVERYRVAARDEAAVKSNDYDPAERLERLMKVDLQGRRRLIEGTLERILSEMQAADPSRASSWTGLMGFLRQEAGAAAEAEGSVLATEGALNAELSLVYWSAVKAPPALDKPVRRLIELDATVARLRREAQAAWLSRSGSPTDHLLKDKALDAYVSALDAFDAELARTLELPEAAADAAWTRSLDGLFGVRASLARRRDRLQYGRGLLTLDAAIALGESRLLALRFDPSETREIAPASETVAFLRGMKARWVGRTEALPALVALRSKDGVTWSSPAEVKRLETAGRVSDLAGRRFVAPELWVGRAPATADEALAAGWSEVVEGDDAARERLAQARSRRAEAARRAALDRALASTEVVLDGGAAGSSLTLGDLRRLEGEGRVLWFEARPDPRTGLRKAVPVPAARLRAPSELISLVRVDGPAPDPSAYPSLEALESSGASASYRRAELGRAGLLALAAEAKAQALSARRAGWLKLKLSSWGFALDEGGEVAAVYLDKDELEKAADAARDPKDPSHKWTFHKTADLSIGLGEDGTVVAARVGSRTIALGGTAATWLGEAPLALETDAQGRVRRVFNDKESLSRKAGGWWVEDASGRVWKDTDAEYAPTAKPKRWLDPETGFSVILGRELEEARLSSARRAATAARHWAYSPGQWPDLLFELPRGVVQIPIELITGRDPNQHGYLGGAYARRGEGGASVRRGPGGTLLHAIDILGILPDPVQRYFDPSQFPSVVDNDGALNPGEGEHSKDPSTVDGRLNLIFGSGALMREARWAQEDREASRAEALSAFRGGARRETLETVRGRAGSYAESYVRSETGRAAFLAALAELGLGAGEDGGTLSADPRRAATDRVVMSYLLELGAEGQDARLRLYEEELKKLEARPEAKADAFDADIAAAQASLSAALAARRAAEQALADLVPNMPGESSLVMRLASR